MGTRRIKRINKDMKLILYSPGIWVEILCITQIPGEYRINFISLLILLILLVSGNTYLKKCQALCLRRRYVAVAEKLASPCHNVLFHVHFIYYAEHSYSAYYCSHSN